MMPFFGTSSSSDGVTTTYPTTSFHIMGMGFSLIPHTTTPSEGQSNGTDWRQWPTTSTSHSTPSSDRSAPIQPLIPSLTRTPIYDHKWTTTSSASNDPSMASTTVIAVTEGRGRAKDVVGMAAIDLYNPVLVLSQFTDNCNYECLQTKCQAFRPLEVVVPNSLMRGDNRLLATLKQHFPQTLIKPLDRKHFNECIGLELIRDLCCDDYKTVEVELKNQYYCLSSCAALIKYIESCEHILYAHKSLRIVFEGSDQTMSIDPTTAQLLELIVNLNDPKSTHTLFGVLNKTKTRSGYRLLRTNLLQPSTDMTLIEKRLDMIEEMISSQTMFHSLESLLAQFTAIEVERVISHLVQTSKVESSKCAERKIECIIVIKHMLTLIEPLADTLRLCESDVFHEFIEMLSDNRFDLILCEVNEVIEESCKYTKGSLNMKLEKCHAIRKHLNSLLDIARQTYSENIDDITLIVDNYCTEYELPLKVTYTTNRGFHMQIAGKDANQMQFSIPSHFTRISYSKSSVAFTTQQIIDKNNRINSAIKEIYLMSDAIISELVVKIREHIVCLYNLSEVLSKIDLVFALAYQCSVGNYIRPQFGQYLGVKQGRHPILEKMLNTAPVANNFFMSEDKNFIVITGPNMSGKSTFLKQVALHQVMAQIGSYIPAESASFRLCDKLFSRIGNNNEIETNSSTFMVEMREMSHILHNCTDSSLIIIDELGRGTSTEEGVGLCFAISEQLIQSKALTIFATHFTELTKLQDFYLNVSNYKFGVEHLNHEINRSSYTFTHILEPGATQEVLYGIQLANMTALDKNIVGNAKLIAQQLQNLNLSFITRGRDPIKRAKYKLTSMLKMLSNDEFIPNVRSLTDLIDDYKDEVQSECEHDIQDLQNDFSLI